MFPSLPREKWPEHPKHFHCLFQNDLHDLQMLEKWFSLVCSGCLNLLGAKWLFRSVSSVGEALLQCALGFGSCIF